jgi:hypothetical protein
MRPLGQRLALDTWQAAYNPAEKLTNPRYDRNSCEEAAGAALREILKSVETRMKGADLPPVDDGHWTIEGLFSAAECIALLQGLRDRPRSRAGARHLMSCPAIAALAHDERLLAAARAGLGGRAVPFRATLFEKSGESNWLVVWHQDTALPLSRRLESAEWGPWSEKAGICYAHAPAWALARVIALRVHLDDSTAANGPLRVLPGSHRRGVLSDEEVFRLARQSAPVDCVVSRGGVLAMRPLVIHSSGKAASPEPRRVVHIEYADDLNLSPGIRLAIA